MIAATATTPTTAGSVALLAVARLGIPQWASGMADIRVTLPFDDTQMVMFAVVNNRLGLAIADSGAYQTVMDHWMVQAFGLCMHCAENGDCGRYSVPGSGVERDYTGVVEASFMLKLGEHISFMLTGMQIIDNPFALFLLGADIMCGGRAKPSWNYAGV